MGFKRTTQQLALVTAGVTIDTISKEQMKALIDWIGLHPGGDMKTQKISDRTADTAHALNFEPRPHPFKDDASPLTSYVWEFSKRFSALGLDGVEDDGSDSFEADADGANLKALIGPYYSSLIEKAPSDLPVFDYERFISMVELVVRNAGGKLTTTTDESGWPAREARFTLPDGRSIVYSLVFEDVFLSIYLTSPKRHSQDYRVHNVVTMETVGKLGDQLTGLFCQSMSTYKNPKDAPPSAKTGFAVGTYDHRVSRV